MIPHFSLNTHFEELLKKIRPPEDRIELAQELPPLVRDYIAKSKDFLTVAPHSRLVGSYAQKMGAGDVKDVDTLIRVPGNPLKNEPEAKKLIGDLKKLLDGLPAHLGYEGYTVEIRSRHYISPAVRVIAPELPRKAPHCYQDGTLCLFYPKESPWRRDMLIATTILPWTALWLYYYELWLDTGKWLGPSSHASDLNLQEWSTNHNENNEFNL